jgi:PII-like signaling protein
VKGKRVSIFLSESDKWQQHPLYLELLRALARENVEYAFVIRSMAGFIKSEDMATKVSSLGVSGYQPLIIEFAESIENVERAMTRIAEMTAGKAFTTVEWKFALGQYHHDRHPESPVAIRQIALKFTL